MLGNPPRPVLGNPVDGMPALGNPVDGMSWRGDSAPDDGDNPSAGEEMPVGEGMSAGERVSGSAITGNVGGWGEVDCDADEFERREDRVLGSAGRSVGTRIGCCEM